MQVSWILDIAVVAVMAVFVIWGIHRGFIRTAVHLIGGIVSLVAAALVSTPVATWIYDQFLATPLTAFIREQVGNATVSAAATLQEQLNAVFATLPSFVTNLLGVYDASLLSAEGSAVAAEELTTMISTSILRPVCLSLLQVIVFLVVFIVACLVMRLLGGMLHKLFASLPLINRVNDALGGVLGLIESLLAVYVLSLLLGLYMTMAGAGSVVTSADIEATYLLRYFMNVNWNGLTVFW